MIDFARPVSAITQDAPIIKTQLDKTNTAIEQARQEALKERNSILSELNELGSKQDKLIARLKELESMGFIQGAGMPEKTSK